MSQAYASKGIGSLGLMESAKEERMKTSREIRRFMPCKENVEQKMMEEIEAFTSLLSCNEWKAVEKGTEST